MYTYRPVAYHPIFNRKWFKINIYSSRKLIGLANKFIIVIILNPLLIAAGKKKTLNTSVSLERCYAFSTNTLRCRKIR